MSKLRLIGISGLLFVLLTATLLPARAESPSPSDFYGDITYAAEDTAPSAGDTVEAYVPDVSGTAATALITEASSILSYDISIPGDDPLTTEIKEGGYEGDEVVFVINGRTVARAIWESATDVQLDFHPPLPISGEPYSASENTEIDFSGSVYDSGDDGALWEWDWDNDGLYDTTGQTASNTWTDDNVEDTYIVGLKVTDAQGGEGEIDFEVTVTNVAPTAVFNAPASANEGDSFQISLGAPYYDPSPDDSADGFEFSFDCGYGYNSWSETTSRTCLTWDDETRTVKGKIRDTDLDETEYTASVTIANVDPTANANTTGSAYAVNEGVSITFHGSGDDVDDDTLTYEWDFDYDGSTFDIDASGTIAPSHTYPDNGSYTVALRVTDDDGGWDIDTDPVTVANVAPTSVSTGSPYSGSEGVAIVFTGSASDVPADTLVYEWDFDYSGTFSADATGASTSHIYPDNGTFSVALRVTDDDGGAATDIDPSSVTVANVTPTAVLGSDTYSGNEGASINFTATANDVAADPLTIEWDFNYDGTFSADAAATGDLTPSHTYPDDGTFTVRLRVSDGDGGVTTDDATVTVSNVAPTADAGGPYSGNEGTSIAFTGTADDADGDTLTYEWDFDYDGSTFDVDASGSLTPAHTYDDEGDGSYTVALRVTDDDGGETTDTAVVTVSNVAPTATWTAPSTVNEGANINISLTSPVEPSSADLAAGLEYAFDCGDGAGYSTWSTTVTSASCPTDDSGARTVKGKIRDVDGGVTEYTRSVTINNVAPTGTWSASPSVNEGNDISVSLTYSYDPSSADIAAGFTYAFDCGSGVFGSYTASTTTSCPTTDNGSVTVRGRIKDKDGGYTEYSSAVTVNDVPPSAASAGGPYTGTAGVAVSLSASATCVSVDTCTYTWDLDNDGQYDDATGASASRTWNTIGVYPIGVKVTDDDASFTTAATTVTINGATHSISLVVGWNLVSFRLHPADTAPAVVLASVAGNFDLVYAWDATGAHTSSGNWLKYDNIPISPDSLTSLDEKMGFWIHMTVADTLDVVGSIPSSTAISLYDNVGGWNLVGYPSASERILPDALSLNGVPTTDFTLVYAYDVTYAPTYWRLFDPAMLPMLNTLTGMKDSWGYWIKVIGDPTWTVGYLAL